MAGGGISGGRIISLDGNYFIHGSMMDVSPDIFSGADVIYTDPPWNQGVLNMFYNRAGVKPPDFSEIVLKIIKWAWALGIKALCVEMGMKQHEEEIAVFERAGFKTAQIYQQKYSGVKPSILWTTGLFLPGQEGLVGMEAVGNVAAQLSLQGYRFGIDPFCGAGIYPFMMLDAGIEMVGGVELLLSKIDTLIASGEKRGMIIKETGRQNEQREHDAG